MRVSPRVPNPAARLGCEALEDRATPAAAFALGASGLVSFDTADPADATSTPVTGVRTGEVLVGLDFRPQDDALYALGVNAGANTGTLYTINTATGAATAVGTPGAVAFVDAAGAAVDLPTASTGYGVDFDPATDELSVVTGNGLNFRVDPNTGAAVDGNTGLPGSVNGTNTDGAINGLPAGSTGVSATAFAAAAGSDQASAAVQYTLDAGSNSLFVQGALSSGAQTDRLDVAKDSAALDFSGANGFDIADGVGVAALTVGSSTRLYEIDLATGAATELGVASQTLTGLALAPPAGEIAFAGATFTATEGGLAAGITLTRTGGSNGEVSVTVTATDGTATAGPDFIPGPYTVTFADGQDTATLTILIDNLDAAEPDESFTLALSAPTGGASLGAQATATVVITDGGELPPPPVPVTPDTAPGMAVGTGVGGVVQVLNDDRSVRYGFFPYGEEMTAGVRVASGDVTGDGVDDVITTPALGAAHVKVFDGATGAEIRSFLAFEGGYAGGLSVASGDVNYDGHDDIIVGTANDSSHVKVIDGATGTDLYSFFAFGGFGGGITVASGDVNGDGLDDIITGTATGNSHVTVFSAGSLKVLQSFFAFRGYAGGVNVAADDLNGDGRADVIVGTASSSSHVKVFADRTGEPLHSFRAFALPYSGGVSVATRDVNHDGLADILVSTASGAGHVKGFDGGTAEEVNGFLAFGAGFSGGVFIN